MDKALLPEGCPRCSLGKFLIWMGVLAVVLAWGGYWMARIFLFGIGETALDNTFGFGLWITFDLAVIALGAGAFFTGLLRYILNIDPLKHIINLAVIIGFICYSGAMIVLALDVGQPLRSWFGFWHANVHSMLVEVMFCITCYLMVLAIEYVPIILENRQLNKIPFLHNMAHNFHLIMPLFAGMGAFLSFFHQGSLGGMYGVLFSRPYSYRPGFFIWPWTFFLFVLSAVASGPVFTMLIATVIEKASGRKMVDFKIKALMGKIAGTMLLVYVPLKIMDTWGWATSVLPEMGLNFSDLFHGVVYGQWQLWTEIVICGVIPMIMLNVKSIRENPMWLYTAAILDCIGVSINRYVFTVQGLAAPVMPFDQWELYIPNEAEWAPTFLVIAYGAVLISLSYRYLPVFPQEKALNAAK
ncbi:menaquinone reductase integral membrane subunit QrcD [Megalodesulfovibrio gigas]|uniref:Putative polysulfide reductase NrfD n=2 Tax=Megalodesulfovibrio gigas TaxID=879 RepID=T2G871_MEGG1|nr:menaquinone reductase integral membrane subunit QrcD [Megalodesulfovibrio gigas]AGS82801.1 putative polysulfide reductase NrfD [Megalodesulfovibrio gigas]AGW12067.1 putative polysulfide reductase NrfD [Megalodesulfovibrio gigas DSM 1382 = ATCC 19364]